MAALFALQETPGNPRSQEKKGRGSVNINMEYYRVFYQVGKLGSITAAAETLCISQPAVSQAIKQMEKALNSRLFIRTQKGVRLTAEGELLFPYVERGIENLLDGERMLRRLVDLDMGEVRIGASDMTLQFYLLPYLERFHGQYPNIKVTVSNAPTPETIESLYEGKIDFGVVSTPFDARPEVEALEVRKIRNTFVAGNKYWKLKGKRMEYEELKELPCIFLEKNTSTRRFMDQFLEKRGILLEPEFELATSDMIVQFAIRNMGIGCVMAEFAREKIEAGELFELAFREMMPEREICIVTDRKNSVSPSGEKFLRILRQGHSSGREIL